MIHPDTELRFINPQVGYGVFATALIPAGTIIYVEDALDMTFPPQSILLQDPRYQDFIKKYSVRNQNGEYIMCWDIAKYVNHCCQGNAISTGYGFEIAIRDIASGEEITDDYGLFNLEEEFPLICSHADCRGKISPDDIDVYRARWDEAVIKALKNTLHVSQPLWDYLDADTHTDLMRYLTTGEGYQSVSKLKLQPASENEEMYDLKKLTALL